MNHRSQPFGFCSRIETSLGAAPRPTLCTAAFVPVDILGDSRTLLRSNRKKKKKKGTCFREALQPPQAAALCPARLNNGQKNGGGFTAVPRRALGEQRWVSAPGRSGSRTGLWLQHLRHVLPAAPKFFPSTQTREQTQFREFCTFQCLCARFAAGKQLRADSSVPAVLLLLAARRASCRPESSALEAVGGRAAAHTQRGGAADRSGTLCRPSRAPTSL